jgi:hypothetical protein
VRGLEVCRVLESLGVRSLLVVSEHARRFVRAIGSEIFVLSSSVIKELQNECQRFSGIVVDSFPLGIRGELLGFVERFRRSAFIARYRKGGIPQEELKDYSAIVAPYCEETDEWGGQISAARHAGLIIKQDRVKLSSPQNSQFIVFDTGGRCSSHFLSLLRRCATRAGLELHIKQEIPEWCAAQKILFIGAGYNTFYETCGQSADVRYVPLHRRWDDQHARVSRYGLGVLSPQELEVWLGSSARATGIEVIERQLAGDSGLREMLGEML